MKIKPLKLLLTLALLGTAGCVSIGPGAVRRDQMHYSTAVADSWKAQLLLNIVKTRFGDAPAFLEVASVVSGYTLETGVNLGGQFSPASAREGETFYGAGVSGKYTDRPTISYSPMTGERYVRSLMAPVPLESLLFVMQGGASADFLLALVAQSIEGKQNLSVLGEQVEAADPQFIRLLQLLRALQRANAIEFEITRKGDSVETWLEFQAATSSPAEAEQTAEVKALLGVPKQVDRVKIVFGTQNPEPKVVAIRTRSLMQILATLGASVQIPLDRPAHEHSFPVDPSLAPRGFLVHSGEQKPANGFAAVPYEGLWFWIDPRDLDSKTTLSIVTLLFNFLEGGSKTAPVLTIPAQ